MIGVRLYCNGVYRRNCKNIKVTLHGKTAIITGANTGIGKETAIDLARRGARVIIACRDVQKAREAVKDIQRQSESSNVLYKHLDLSVQASVRQFAEDIIKEESRLDYLINNAGIFKAPRAQRTAEGYNMVFATNHFDHFLLTMLLLDLLKKSAPSRIINVASIAHTPVRRHEIHFDRRDSQGRLYPALHEYDRSKLANIWFTKELARRLEGTGVSVFSLNPGAVNTTLLKRDEFTSLSRPVLFTILMLYRLTVPFYGINDETGAQTTLYCVLEESLPELSGGYFDNCRLTKETALTRDIGMAKKLWEVSCEATGMKD